MAREEQEIASRCMELLDGIDPEMPAIDQELAGERLVAYVRALGVETVPKVRWLPGTSLPCAKTVSPWGGAAIGVPSRRGRDSSCGNRGNGCPSPHRG